MDPTELRAAVRSLADEDVDVEDTAGGCIATRQRKAIQFWVDKSADDSFQYTRTVGGKPDDLGILRSSDVADVLLYL